MQNPHGISVTNNLHRYFLVSFHCYLFIGIPLTITIESNLTNAKRSPATTSTRHKQKHQQPPAIRSQTNHFSKATPRRIKQKSPTRVLETKTTRFVFSKSSQSS